MRLKLRALLCLLPLLPLDAIVVVCLLLTECLGLAFRIRRRAPPLTTVALKISATIQILNWDGRHLLEESVPAALAAVQQAGGGHEVVVVDNGSSDGSVEFIREQYPEVRVVALDRNYRFTGGNNRGLETSDRDVVVLLNNDMVVEPAFLTPLLEGFRDPAVFAMTSQVFLQDSNARRVETGKTRACYDGGFFTMWHDAITRADEQLDQIPVFWGGGGSCAFDRQKFLAIGGLDSLYDPFYVEDTDISYQAWKRGWKCLLAPSSRVVHRHRATNTPRFGGEFLDNTIRRNQYLFVWKNVTEPRLFLKHLLGLPRIHARFILAGPAGFEMRAFFRAFVRLPLACWHRLRGLSYYVVSDSEVLRTANENGVHPSFEDAPGSLSTRE